MADHEPPPRPAVRARGASRGEAPLWRQAAEGIGMVVALSLAVAVVGFVLALLVSLIF